LEKATSLVERIVGHSARTDEIARRERNRGEHSEEWNLHVREAAMPIRHGQVSNDRPRQRRVDLASKTHDLRDRSLTPWPSTSSRVTATCSVLSAR
jgi:hypothetical protein